MNRTTKRGLAVATVSALALATLACTDVEVAPEAAAPISEADAATIADATVAAWTSMDAAKVKAIYGPGVVAFDFAAPDLEVDRATFDAAQDAFAAAKYDGAKQISRNIQILDADTFVMSGIWDITSSATPENNSSVRCTDVFQKDDAGNWPIVNEHCSPVPATT